MKTLALYFCIFFSFTFNLCNSQQETLQEKILRCSSVVEGHVIYRKSFGTGRIYTSAIIRVTKIFKGDIPDSTIEIILHGGNTDSVIDIGTESLGLDTGLEGIFLLNENKTEPTRAANLKSYSPTFERASYIQYDGATLARCIAFCVGVCYHNLEKDVFEPIEAVTGEPPKILGLNMFERTAAANKAKH